MLQKPRPATLKVVAKIGHHLGALFGRYELLNRLRVYKVRPADDAPFHKFDRVST